MRPGALFNQSLFVFILQIIFLHSFSQNVGIGTSTPQHPLDVNGAINNNVEYRLFGKTILKVSFLNGGWYWNLYAGDSAGYANSTGAANTFIGSLAGKTNTSGHGNTASGFATLYSN